MSRWIDSPAPPLVRSRAFPLLVETASLDALAAHYARAHRVDADVRDAATTPQVIGALKAVLPFPDWCGSNWDALDDAHDELLAAWSFPLLLVVRGFDRLLARHQHLALATTLNLHALRRAFARDGEQLIVVLEGASWT